MMRGERVVGEVVSDWRSWAVLGTAVLGFIVAQNWEGLKQTMNTWFTPDEVSPRATMMAVIPTVEPQPMFVPKSIDPIPRSLATKTQTSTATQEATATSQPTPEGPIVDKMIFDRGSVDPSTVKLIINPVNNDGIGRYYDQGSVTTVFVLPEKIFLAKDDKYYCKCYLDTGDPVIFQVGEVRTYVAGERIKLVEESQYGKLSVDFGNRTAGVNIRAQRPSEGWTIRRIRNYLLDTTKEVTSLSVQITLTK